MSKFPLKPNPPYIPDPYIIPAKDEINSSNNSNGWISVKERLPEDKESVIYWHDLHGNNIGHYDSTSPKPNYHWWSYNYGDHADFRVQWWMPLPKIPEPPKGED